jgi:hypothetical protein
VETRLADFAARQRTRRLVSALVGWRTFVYRTVTLRRKIRKLLLPRLPSEAGDAHLPVSTWGALPDESFTLDDSISPPPETLADAGWPLQDNAPAGLSPETWRAFQESALDNGTTSAIRQIYSSLYLGGCDPRLG